MKVKLLRIERLEADMSESQIRELMLRGYKPQQIDGKQFMALCDKCDKFILDGDGRKYDSLTRKTTCFDCETMPLPEWAPKERTP